jgi:hypothetical protein
LEQTNKTTRSLLFVLEGVGTVFIGIFLAAYLGGMFMNPSTTVLHSEPAFRIPLIVLGIALLVLILAIVVLSAYTMRSKEVTTLQ